MMLAVADCNTGIPVKPTARKYSLPYATLCRPCKKGYSILNLEDFEKYSVANKRAISKCICKRWTAFFKDYHMKTLKRSFTHMQKRTISCIHKVGTGNKKAGDDWLAGFLNRNPQITLRVSEATAIDVKERVKGFNRPQIERFYELLNNQTEKHCIDRIYNVDETGIQTSKANKLPKVLSVKGKKQVGIIASTERGQIRLMSVDSILPDHSYHRS
ncbi:unnamed protein product [Parnassius apollo]|uniref:(apollo) hypothetical protein n=1 Tax=Parnassius apollo TaxID=110799 RepID=A0A8S3WXX8_PARAO|nr:unnamed protein product [Parnassius apollo]